jgi:hypothetical protein
VDVGGYSIRRAVWLENGRGCFFDLPRLAGSWVGGLNLWGVGEGGGSELF